MVESEKLRFMFVVESKTLQLIGKKTNPFALGTLNTCSWYSFEKQKLASVHFKLVKIVFAAVGEENVDYFPP